MRVHNLLFVPLFQNHRLVHQSISAVDAPDIRPWNSCKWMIICINQRAGQCTAVITWITRRPLHCKLHCKLQITREEIQHQRQLWCTSSCGDLMHQWWLGWGWTPQAINCQPLLACATYLHQAEINQQWCIFLIGQVHQPPRKKEMNKEYFVISQLWIFFFLNSF